MISASKCRARNEAFGPRKKKLSVRGSDEGGRRAAIMYTLIETARLNDIDPEAWLDDVISRITNHPIRRSTNCSHGMERRRFAGYRRIVARGRHITLTLKQKKRGLSLD
jgi:IS66 C-terminal element